MENTAQTASDVVFGGVGKLPEDAFADDSNWKNKILGGAGEKFNLEKSTSVDEDSEKSVNAADPQKGKWGGKSVNNGRKLSAKVEKIPNENYVRRVIFRVSSTNQVEKPLKGKVVFHLHPTFTRQIREADVVDGIAEISLVAYGAFTVGAEADNGGTLLEFDLVDLDDGDSFFKR